MTTLMIDTIRCEIAPIDFHEHSVFKQYSLVSCAETMPLSVEDVKALVAIGVAVALADDASRSEAAF